jgi:predicted ATPase
LLYIGSYQQKETYTPRRIGFERVIYSEMVGKDKELDKVVLQVIKAIDGKSSVVNVIVEAGIGKSRLIAELKIQVLVNKVILLEGRAISIGRNLSYFAITNLLKNWVRIKKDDNEIEYLFKHALA